MENHKLMLPVTDAFVCTSQIKGKHIYSALAITTVNEYMLRNAGQQI